MTKTTKQNPPAKSQSSPKLRAKYCADPNEETGVGKVVGFVIFATVLIAYPAFLRACYPEFKHRTEEWGWSDKFLYGMMGAIQGIVTQIFLGALMYGPLYYFEIPFFEKYKAFDEPWPWKTDKNKWRNMFICSLILLIFNQVIINSLLSFAPYLTGMEVDFDFSVEGLPSTTKLLMQVAFCALAEDFAFHIGHRLLHTKYLY